MWAFDNGRRTASGQDSVREGGELVRCGSGFISGGRGSDEWRVGCLTGGLGGFATTGVGVGARAD